MSKFLFFEDVRPNNFTNFHTIFLRKVSKERYCICLQCYRELFCILLKNFELNAVLYEIFIFLTIFQKFQFRAPRMTLLKPKFKIFTLFGFSPVFYEYFKLNWIQNWQFFKKLLRFLNMTHLLTFLPFPWQPLIEKNFFFVKYPIFQWQSPSYTFGWAKNHIKENQNLSSTSP